MQFIIAVICLLLFFYFYLKNNSNIKVEYKISTNLPLMIGVVLIILSSIFFITSSWKSLSSIMKIIGLASETMLFFILGIVVKRVFKADKTGNALTFIGSILIGITAYSMLYFNIFNLNMKGKTIFLMDIFLLEFIVFVFRKGLLGSKHYFLQEMFLFLAFYTLIYFLSGDYVFSLSILSIILLIVNLLKNKLFKSNKEFNIFNILLTTIISFAFLITIAKGKDVLLNNVSYIVMLVSLLINIFYSIRNKDRIFTILFILYDVLLTGWFALFSSSLVTSSYVLFISSIVLFVLHYFSNSKKVSYTSLIISYIYAVVSFIIICFDKTFIISAPIIPFTYLLLSSASVAKNKSLKPFTIIIQPLFLMLFGISILLQPSIFKNISFNMVILVMNIMLFVITIISSILKSSLKKGYYILNLIGLFIGISLATNDGLPYIIIPLIINFILVIYFKITKKDKLFFINSLLLVYTILMGFRKYDVISNLIIFAVLLLFAIFASNKKQKYSYILVSYVPIISLISKITFISNVMMNDIKTLLLVPYIIIFTRKLINDNNENELLLLELILFSFIFMAIENDLFYVLFIILLTIISCLIKQTKIKSINAYLNYTFALIPITLVIIESIKYEGIYLLAGFTLMLINHILYRIRLDKRNIYTEATHAIISLIILTDLIEVLEFNNFITFIISSIFILISYFIYENQTIKNLTLAFMVYPLTYIIKYVPNIEICNILNMFIWMMPVVILTRLVLNIKDDTKDIIEVIVISFMFLKFMFIKSIVNAISLIIISIISIITGRKLKILSLKKTGYVSLILVIIINFILFFKTIPWWLLLLITGITLVVVAGIKESKK